MLILLRHGQSAWNADDRFAGWVDVDLTRVGADEARRAGAALLREGLLPDEVHTSALRRSIRTAILALQQCSRSGISWSHTWRLNERHYGALQGQRRSDVNAQFGHEQYMRWRRSWDERPPLSSLEDARQQAWALHCDSVPREAITRGESLADVQTRLLPYWHASIAPGLRAGRTVLVVAHGNSLRALLIHLGAIAHADIRNVRVPTGVPVAYELDDRLRPRGPGTELRG